ncbi:hypothetical protein [Azoarcus sp. KH32C]|uniref:hypothetical protein n=1 Tax=Azoarcus sp. KH32C TaxID=748247 RepID=UPI0002386C92|nr:hypothetical protein [Azoarcus sp. KH32C]BAL24909.1 hypothetical protein AZKH_2603 [Azoarcus sp. KH32C]
MTLTIRAETSMIGIPSRNVDAAMGALASVPQDRTDTARVDANVDIPADHGISAEVALHAQKIADSRRLLDERVSMQQVATGTVAQFSAYMNAIRTQIQRTTGHISTNFDRLGLDSAVKGLNAELDRAGANHSGSIPQHDDTMPAQRWKDLEIQDADSAAETTQLARASILGNAARALQAQANTPSRWTLSLLTS